jgi:hypothetical protein
LPGEGSDPERPNVAFGASDATKAALGTVTEPQTHDRLITADQQRELVAAIPAARAVWIGAGHGAPAELPAEFARLVLEFVSAAP